MRIERPMLCLLAAFSAAAAATPPPTLPFEDEDWEARVDQKPATGLILGNYKIRFEQTRLRDVIHHAGGSIQHQGDAGGSIYGCGSLRTARWVGPTIPSPK
jgi:hypothetical protein